MITHRKKGSVVGEAFISRKVIFVISSATKLEVPPSCPIES
jgi:hypothetical protein